MRKEMFLRLVFCATLLGVAGAVRAQEPVKWEYKVVNFECPVGPCAPTIAAKLKELGDQGFELVHVLRDWTGQPGTIPAPSNQFTAIFKKSNIATVIADYKTNAETAQKAISELKKDTLEAIKSSLAPAVKDDPETVAAIARQIDVTRLNELERRLRTLEERRPQ